jgi:hypothetical protein
MSALSAGAEFKLQSSKCNQLTLDIDLNVELCHLLFCCVCPCRFPNSISTASSATPIDMAESATLNDGQ